MAGTRGGDPGSQRRWPALDGLRGVAIVLVILYHFHLPGRSVRHLVGGWVGVDLFFVLSGFLITTLLVEERYRTGSISRRAFYRRRWIRLGPPLIALIVTFEVLSLFLKWSQMPIYSSLYRMVDIRSVVSLGPNWWVIGQATVHPFLWTIWSLGIEEQFYLLWPLVVLWAFSKRTPERGRRVLLAVAIGGAVLSATEALVMHQASLSRARVYFGTDTRAQALFVGAALALVLGQGRRAPAKVSGSLAVAGAVGIGAIVVGVSDTNPFQVGGSFTVLAVASALLIAHAVEEPTSLIARVLSTNLLRWTGQRSYALYLWHGGIATYLYASRRHSSTRYGWPGYLAGIALSFVMAELSWRLIESTRARSRWATIRDRFALPRAQQPGLEVGRPAALLEDVP